MSEAPEKDPHFEELMVQLSEYMKPAATYDEAGLKLTTKEVFDRLQALYPSTTYTEHEVYLALKELDFVHADPFKDMRYVWLFK
jgi:hypothetical protein